MPNDDLDEVGTEPLPMDDPEPEEPAAEPVDDQAKKRAGWREAQRRRRERAKAKTEPGADPDAEQPEHFTDPAPKRPVGRPPKRNRTRVPLTSLLETTLGGASTGLIMTGRDVPVGMAIGFEAPVAAEKLDAIIAGTMLDRLLQPIARAGASAKDFGAVLALPILVGLIERRPYLYEPLKPLIIPVVTNVALDLAELQERNKERLSAAQSRAGATRVDVEGLLNMLFGNMPVQPPVQAQPVEEPAAV